MRARSFVALFAAVATVVSAAACGNVDSPAAPARAVRPATTASSTLLGSPTTITPLLRNSSLSSNVTVSKNIGILGGAIAIPSAGITLVVPALALSSTKTISVTALAGNQVAYEFSPHGTTFNVPLVMLQDLSNTQAQTGGLVNPLNLSLGYFPNSSLPTTVTELLGVNVNLLTQIGVSTIWHFSGYIVATGREAEEY
jgi:hypothetical protein